MTVEFHEHYNVKPVCCAEYRLREINTLCDITQYVLGSSYQRFVGTYRLHLQGENTSICLI